MISTSELEELHKKLSALIESDKLEIQTIKKRLAENKKMLAAIQRVLSDEVENQAPDVKLQ